MPIQPLSKFKTIARGIVTPQTTQIHPFWSKTAIQSAILNLRVGTFDLAAQLLRSMYEDDEFPGTIQKRINATLRSEFSLALPGESRPLEPAEEQAQVLFSWMAPDCELFDLLQDYIMLGAGVATIDWDDKHESGFWVPRIRHLPAEFLRYDTERRVYLYHSREGEELVEPGNGKWILLAAGQEAYDKGLILGLARTWFSKQLTLADWERYNEKHGLPIFKARVPIHRDATEKDRFVDDLGNIQTEGIIGLPQDENGNGYDLDLLEPRDTAWETFQNAVERCDRKMQVSLLGGNLGAEVTSQGANRAAAETHAASVDRDKAKSDAKTLGVVLKDQLMKPFVRVNFDRADQIVPFPFWDTCPEESIRAWVTSQSTFVHMLGQMPAAGVKLLNIEQLGREYGLDLELLPGGPVMAQPADGGGISHKTPKGQK